MAEKDGVKERKKERQRSGLIENVFFAYPLELNECTAKTC